MILEGVITTRNADAAAHITPMGFQRHDDTVLIAPFVPSTTLVNLRRDGHDVLTIIVKGGRTRMTPVIRPAITAVAAYMAQCPYKLEPGTALFRGARGGPLSPRIIQLTVERMRGSAIYPGCIDR